MSTFKETTEVINNRNIRRARYWLEKLFMVTLYVRLGQNILFSVRPVTSSKKLSEWIVEVDKNGKMLAYRGVIVSPCVLCGNEILVVGAYNNGEDSSHLICEFCRRFT